MTSLGWERVTAWRTRRTHLARRASINRLNEVVEGLCGAHAQIMSTVPLALGARISKLTSRHVSTALNQDRTLVKTWAMRGTLHVFSADDLPIYCAAMRTRDQYTNPSFLKYFGLEAADVEAVLDAVPQALDGRALTREELSDAILAITGRPHLEDRLRSGWGEMLKPAAFRGLLCFGPQDGRSVTFVRPDQWIRRWEDHETDAAVTEVFRRFLSAYAPASRAEIARWWGVRPPQAGRILALMSDELTEVEVDGSKRWILKKDLASLRSARAVAGVRLLPAFDQLLVMSAPHTDAIVDPKFVDRIYTPRIAVWSSPAVLIDGRVRASWKLERKTTRSVVRVMPFKKLPRPAKIALSQEVARVGALLDTDVVLELVEP